MSGGRPTKFKEEFVEQALKLCSKFPVIDNDLAELFDVSVATIDNWKANYPEFLGAIKKGKEIQDARVERSLFERAVGYSHPETKIATHEGIITDSQEFERHYPPDTAAAFIWLKNRQPEKWRDKSQVEVSERPPIELVTGEKAED